MGKKLPSLWAKHLETSAKKFRTLQGEMDLCSLLDFYCSVRALLPPLCPAPPLAVTTTKEFRRNLELFKILERKKKIADSSTNGFIM